MTKIKRIKQADGQSLASLLGLIIKFSVPAILAQLSSVIMQYIDAAMVGRLGTQASASIGLVSTTTWLVGSAVSAFATGFSVQVAHSTGAGDYGKARSVIRHGLLTVTVLCSALSAVCVSVSRSLPIWLGGGESVREDATAYFFVYALMIPAMGLSYSAGGMLQCSGNMKIPGILNIMKCALDVVFNYIFIFPSRYAALSGKTFMIPGFGLGVTGAALGTAVSEIICALLMLRFLLFKSDSLRLRKETAAGVYLQELKKAVKIAVPIGVESVAMGFAYVASTKIVAPLGNISLTAHSFSITAESLCYMPGYGIGAAATALAGRAAGAGKADELKRLSKTVVFFGCAVMTVAGAIMYLLAPQMIGILSKDPDVRDLGTQILRIEAFAEPLYAASIVVSGVFRGLGDTLIPSIINLASMWGVRIPLSAFLAGKFGLQGVWIAMALELSVRGIAMLMRLIIKSKGKELYINVGKSD